jgi:cytochrome c-type biogenesis protein CcmH/NrfG
VETAAVEKAAAEKAGVDKADEDDTAEATEATESGGKVDEETDSTGKPKTSRVAAAGGSENRKLLADAQRMLRAERFAEARGLFEKLAKSKRERGQALVGLAEISFQEKKYADAARAAERAADRGGGVKAHVLLGDAHFRLARYKEAAKAYENALKIDPRNASAKSGLALANKRM